MVSREVEEIKILEDGKHTGVIVGVEYTDKPFEYVKVVIEAQGATLKASYPFKIMKDSKLGLKLRDFGAKLEVGNMIDPDNYFKTGTKVEFITMKKITERGVFANIINESLKPLGENTTTHTITTI